MSGREIDELLFTLDHAKKYLSEQVSTLGLPYTLPTLEPLTVFYRA